MTELHTGQVTTAGVKMCPDCGSADVDTASVEFAGTLGAGCNSCPWVGSTGDLVVQQFRHEMGSDEQIFKSMVTDLRNILAKEFLGSFGKFLMKWGFISKGVTPVILSRYVVAVAQATMSAILEERRKIEQER